MIKFLKIVPGTIVKFNHNNEEKVGTVKWIETSYDKALVGIIDRDLKYYVKSLDDCVLEAIKVASKTFSVDGKEIIVEKI